jgi:hypothetical protein
LNTIESDRLVTEVRTPAEISHLRACCIAQVAAPWLLHAKKSMHNISASFAGAVEAVGGKTAYMLKSGADANRAVGKDFFDNPLKIGGVTICRNREEAADAVWLEPEEAFVDIINGGIMFMAVGGERVLAGRCTHKTPKLIRDKFRLEVELDAVQVTCFFDTWRERRLSPFAKFSQECANVGLTNVTSLCELPAHGYFLHGEHRDLSIAGQYAAGICVRLT